MSLADYKNAHKGKTMLVVGNGSNLSLTPPELFGYPSIGMNTIHLYEGWQPDYYTAVDRRVLNEFSQAVNEKLVGVPKFLPAPRLSHWKDDDVHFWRQRPGRLWSPGKKMWQEDPVAEGIIYANIMHVAIKIAYYMGAKKILIIGMEHKPEKSNAHFWGDDGGMPVAQPTQVWQAGYKILAQSLKDRKVKLLNISAETYVSSDIIEQDDYKKYIEEQEDAK